MRPWILRLTKPAGFGERVGTGRRQRHLAEGRVFVIKLGFLRKQVDHADFVRICQECLGMSLFDDLQPLFGKGQDLVPFAKGHGPGGAGLDAGGQHPGSDAVGAHVALGKGLFDLVIPGDIVRTGMDDVCHVLLAELLDLVGLSGRGNAPISTLSGGQKQRVAIARALAVNPDILFCDEATSALDPQTTRSILSLIKEIQKKMNLTVVMITHQMEVVRDSCDYVAVLDSGRIVEEGAVADVFANPKSATTKDFLSNLTSSHDSVVRWSEDGGRYILQTVNGEEIGIMVCDIGPDKEREEKAVASLLEKGIVVEEEK